ncbi:MAG: hypothetical protein KHY89_02470 [Butyricicoccus pullicaecorum]|nr:hypothetical protein [Butyricicoccus pullicaecorum]
MLKKSICALLSLALLTTSTAYAVNTDTLTADTPASISYNILPREESSSIEIKKGDGELLEYEVEYTDDSVITTHHDGATTTKVEAIYKTGEIITSIYVDGRLQSQDREINESVKNSNQATKISPRLVFPQTYQDIGSVSYKKNDTGVSYVVSFQCKEVSESYSEKFDLNKNVSQTLQFLTTALIAYYNPFQWIQAKSELAKNIVNRLIAAGAISVGTNSIISSVTADYIEGYVTQYKVKYSNQYGAGSTATGTAIYVKSSGKLFKTVQYDDVYPQFLKNRDTGMAALVYYGFDAYGFPGVSSWNATKTVPYATK